MKRKREEKEREKKSIDIKDCKEEACEKAVNRFVSTLKKKKKEEESFKFNISVAFLDFGIESRLSVMKDSIFLGFEFRFSLILAFKC